MRPATITASYYRWLCKFISSNIGPSYYMLFHKLHDTVFTSPHPMDVHRAMDGEALRVRYAEERNDISGEIMGVLSNTGPCSIFEMMIALAIRCEEQIMADDDEGNRTGQWFWGMIQNMRLASMSDERYDEEYVNKRLDIFSKRLYDIDGQGSLFPNINPRFRDQFLDAEIWYQMNWYLSEYLGLVN